MEKNTVGAVHCERRFVRAVYSPKVIKMKREVTLGDVRALTASIAVDFNSADEGAVAIVTVDGVEGRTARGIVICAFSWRIDEEDIHRKGVEVALGKGKMFNGEWTSEAISGSMVSWIAVSNSWRDYGLYL